MIARERRFSRGQQLLLCLLVNLTIFVVPLCSSFQSRSVNLSKQCHTQNLCSTYNFAVPSGTDTDTDTSSSSHPSTVNVKSADETPSTEGNLPFFATWPKWLQNSIRDSGGVKFLIDTATRTIAAPIFYFDNPWCFPEFIRISGREYPWLVSLLRAASVIDDNKPNIRFSKEAYGEHPKQVAQVMISKDVDESKTTAPMFIFLHGGAWGSGFPTMYRLISLPFLERSFRAVILGYRTYPEASVKGQMDDLCLAVNHFIKRYGGVAGSGGPVVLMGHSSGAHISMLAAMQGRLPAVDAFISASGVYDIEAQFDQEKIIGVNEISPMSAANGFSKDNLRKNSPSSLPMSLPFDFPPVLLLHGGADDVTLPRNSEEFHELLIQKSTSLSAGRLGMMLPRRGTKHIKLEVVDGVGHQEVVLDTCLGGNTRSSIMNWLESTLGI